MMPILMRGIKDSNYDLVKKATKCGSNLCSNAPLARALPSVASAHGGPLPTSARCCSNLCALIKESSDIAPFVPTLKPLLEKNLDHSSPDVRTATALAGSALSLAQRTP